MHVALLNPVYWPEVRRGSERFVRELADGLIASGHRPRLVTTHRGLRPERTVEDGLEVVRMPRVGDGRLRRRMFEDHLVHIPTAAWELRRTPPDVAHALHVTGAVAALQAGRAPVVLSYMGIPHRQGLANRRLRIELTQRAVRGAAAVVALSAHAAAGFERWLGVPGVRVIPPGVDLEAFAPDPAARAPQPTILCAAALDEPRKRVALLVEAFGLLRRERGDARLILSRPGGAQRVPAGPGIEVRDLDDRAVLAAANREAWVAALPSIGEAFGLVALEAMACGTPVVASDREALPEVVREGTGVLFAGDEPADLARALRECIELAADPATAARCRARAEECSWERTTAAYVSLYEEVTCS